MKKQSFTAHLPTYLLEALDILKDREGIARSHVLAENLEERLAARVGTDVMAKLKRHAELTAELTELDRRRRVSDNWAMAYPHIDQSKHFTPVDEARLSELETLIPQPPKPLTMMERIIRDSQRQAQAAQAVGDPFKMRAGVDYDDGVYNEDGEWLDGMDY